MHFAVDWSIEFGIPVVPVEGGLLSASGRRWKAADVAFRGQASTSGSGVGAQKGPEGPSAWPPRTDWLQIARDGHLFTAGSSMCPGSTWRSRTDKVGTPGSMPGRGALAGFRSQMVGHHRPRDPVRRVPQSCRSRRGNWRKPRLGQSTGLHGNRWCRLSVHLATQWWSV